MIKLSKKKKKKKKNREKYLRGEIDFHLLLGGSNHELANQHWLTLSAFSAFSFTH